MKWDDFYKKVQDLPVIESRVLRLLFDNKSIELQLNRWVKHGKIIQLKRGYYILEDNYRKLDVYEPYIASILKSPSYISLEKALIDLFYLKRKRAGIEYIRSLRLQNTELLNFNKLEKYADKLDVPFVKRGVSELKKFIQEIKNER